MTKGISISAAGLRPMMTRLEVIANNLANINTAGFKRDAVFSDALKDAQSGVAYSTGDSTGVDLTRVVDYTEGSFSQTNSPLDCAIQGRGFFAVETPAGRQYTRNGHFSISADGALVTQQGYPVLGENGEIHFPDFHSMSGDQIRISGVGEVSVGNQVVGKLRVANFDNLSSLSKTSEQLFASTTPELPAEPDGNSLAVRQGFLEESNVDGLQEMMEMIEMSRTFETGQRLIQSQDSTLDKTMEVGKF
jgi:flagellar basal-body rod protein FlgF